MGYTKQHDHQFMIQNKHEVEWEYNYYFCGSELDKVIEFLRKYDEGYMIYSPQDPHYFNLSGCDEYEINIDLVELVLNKINNGEITDDEFTVDKNELICFLEACIRNGRKTNGTVYIHVH